MPKISQVMTTTSRSGVPEQHGFSFSSIDPITQTVNLRPPVWDLLFPSVSGSILRTYYKNPIGIRRKLIKNLLLLL